MGHADLSSQLIRRLLNCLGEDTFSHTELEEKYKRMYPPSKFSRTFNHTMKILMPGKWPDGLTLGIKMAIENLRKSNHITRNMVYRNKESKIVPVYFITQKGRMLRSNEK